MTKVRLQLENGNVVEAECEDDEYGDIYDAWVDGGRKVLMFEDCAVMAASIQAIQWDVE